MDSEKSLDWRVEALAEYQERRDTFSEKKRSIAQRVERMQQRTQKLLKELQVLDTKIADLDQAAIIFGLLDNQEEIPSSEADSEANEGLQVKHVALDALKEIYPDSLRAAQIKAIVEKKLGKSLHPKTPGMTLYRLSQTGMVRNKGWDWYFVPPDHKEAGGQN